MPKSERRPAGRLWVPSAKGWMKKIASTSDANASVAERRGRGLGAAAPGARAARRPEDRRARRGSPRSRCRSAPPSRAYATAPMPANASGASDTWPAQPVSGTSDSAISAVHMPRAKRLRFVADRNVLMMAMITNSADMPITVSRTVETALGSAHLRRRRANLSLAWGSSNSTMNSMMVGMQRRRRCPSPLNRRNDCDHCSGERRG